MIGNGSRLRHSISIRSLRKCLTHVGRHNADPLHCLLKLLRGDYKLFGSISEFIIFVDIDPVAVSEIAFRRLVGHIANCSRFGSATVFELRLPENNLAAATRIFWAPGEHLPAPGASSRWRKYPVRAGLTLDSVRPLFIRIQPMRV